MQYVKENISTFVRLQDIGGGVPVKVRQSSQHPCVCMQRPPSFLTSKRMQMRRKPFTPTPLEIEYWRKIHELNKQEKPAVPIEKPAPVYIVTTVELVETEGVDQ